MKKLLTVLALIAFSGSVFAANGLTKFTNSVSNGINTINQKEQQLNKTIDNAQSARAKQKAEAKKKAEAQTAELKKQKEAQEKAYKDTKKAVENEVSFWKSLKFWDK